MPLFVRTSTWLTVEVGVCLLASAGDWARVAAAETADSRDSQADVPAARSAERSAAAVLARSGAAARVHCVAATDDSLPADSAPDDSVVEDSAADDWSPAADDCWAASCRPDTHSAEAAPDDSTQDDCWAKADSSLVGSAVPQADDRCARAVPRNDCSRDGCCRGGYFPDGNSPACCWEMAGLRPACWADFPADWVVVDS